MERIDISERQIKGLKDLISFPERLLVWLVRITFFLSVWANDIKFDQLNARFAAQEEEVARLTQIVNGGTTNGVAQKIVETVP